MRLIAVLVTATLALAPTAARADNPPTTSKSPVPEKAVPLSDTDLHVLAHIHHVNETEVKMGVLAQDRGTTAVKAFGKRLLMDHGQADKDLMALAHEHNAVVPTDAPADATDVAQEKLDSAAMDRLMTLKGAEFDKEFLPLMQQAHERELTKIDAAIAAGGDKDVATLLHKVRPVVKAHADTAKRLQKPRGK